MGAAATHPASSTVHLVDNLRDPDALLHRGPRSRSGVSANDLVPEEESEGTKEALTDVPFSLTSGTATQTVLLAELTNAWAPPWSPSQLRAHPMKP